jgi:hypothetical protein
MFIVMLDLKSNGGKADLNYSGSLAIHEELIHLSVSKITKGHMRAN